MWRRGLLVDQEMHKEAGNHREGNLEKENFALE